MERPSGSCVSSMQENLFTQLHLAVWYLDLQAVLEWSCAKIGALKKAIFYVVHKCSSFVPLVNFTKNCLWGMLFFFLSKIQSTVCFLSGVYKRLLLKFWQKRESHRLLMMIYKNCSKFFPLKKCLVASFLFLLYNPTPKSKIYTAISINGVFENQKYKLLITFYVASQTRL